MAKILLVDDDPLLVKMYKSKFELDGNEVVTASNGSDGVKIAGAQKPDLILMDVMMPVMNGIDALKHLKAGSNTKNIPVVMLTNIASSSEGSEEGLELGAVAYLVKSNYTPKEVVQKVKEILSGYVKEVPKVEVAIKQ